MKSKRLGNRTSLSEKTLRVGILYLDQRAGLIRRQVHLVRNFCSEQRSLALWTGHVIARQHHVILEYPIQYPTLPTAGIFFDGADSIAEPDVSWLLYLVVRHLDQVSIFPRKRHLSMLVDVWQLVNQRPVEHTLRWGMVIAHVER